MKITKAKELNSWYESNCSYDDLKKKYNDYNDDDAKIEGKYNPWLDPQRDKPSKWEGLEELEKCIDELEDMKAKLKQERDLRKKAEKEVEAFKKIEADRKAEAEAKAAEAKLKDPDDDGMLGSGIFVAKPVKPV